jgi:hypothetical protein
MSCNDLATPAQLQALLGASVTFSIASTSGRANSLSCVYDVGPNGGGAVQGQAAFNVGGPPSTSSLGGTTPCTPLGTLPSPPDTTSCSLDVQSVETDTREDVWWRGQHLSVLLPSTQEQLGEASSILTVWLRSVENAAGLQ